MNTQNSQTATTETTRTWGENLMPGKVSENCLCMRLAALQGLDHLSHCIQQLITR